MRIVFVGAVEFSRQCLERVIESGGNVVGVFTLTAEAARFNADYSDLAPVASRAGIPLYRVDRINDERHIEAMRVLEPDIIFVFGFSQMIGSKILGMAPLGCIGTHPAMLPRNRGRHPLIWALIEDLTESALTFFALDEGADSGDIVWQESFPITDDDDAGTLYGKIIELARGAIPEILSMVQEGRIRKMPQDHSRATYWPKRSEKDGEIRWNATARQVWNLVRALTHPYVGAHTYGDGAKLTVWRATVLDEGTSPATREDPRPGLIVSTSGESPVVRAGDGFVRLDEWEGPAGFTMTEGSLLGR